MLPRLRGVWHFGGKQFNRTMSTVAIDNGLLYISDLSGYLYCLDVNTGDLYWKHDTFAAIWGSPYVVDGKVYLGDEDGNVLVLKAGKTEQVLFKKQYGQCCLHDTRRKKTVCFTS